MLKILQLNRDEEVAMLERRVNQFIEACKARGLDANMQVATGVSPLTFIVGVGKNIAPSQFNPTGGFDNWTVEQVEQALAKPAPSKGPLRLAGN